MAQSDLTLLSRSVAQLGKRWDELKTLSLAASSLDEKLDILDQMELINIRITRIETLRNHLEAAVITVAPPSSADQQQLSDALSTLSTQIKKDMQWSAAFKLTRNILLAAHSIQTNMTGRQNRIT